MRIGIDVDETLTDTEKSFNDVIKKYNIDFKKKYSDEWTKEERDYLLTDYCEEIISNAKLKKGAKEALDILKSKGHELIIITARCNRYSNLIEKITYDLIKDNNLKIDEIYFDDRTKSALAKRLKIDLMIDDSKKIIENMKKENIDCILFGDKIKTWEEILEYIERKNNG